MKSNTIILCALEWVIAGLLSSCHKDAASTIIEEPKLMISEVGKNNSKIVYAGQELYWDAHIVAPGRIASIRLQITLTETNYGWDLVKTYTGEYKGAKNAHLHEQIPVPENIRTGVYTLLLSVTDEEGESVQDKVDFEIIREKTLPQISDISLKYTSSSLNVSGILEAPNRIEKLLVEVQSNKWVKEFKYADAAMVGKTRFSLLQAIDLREAPNGHYHVNITLFDQVGKHMGYHYHFDKY